MNKKGALFVTGVLLALSGCGTGVASSGVSPSEPVTTPVETLPPTIEDAPPVVTSEPVELAPSVEDELADLEPPEGGQRGPADDAIANIGTVFTVRPCQEINAWLDGRLPSVTSYVDSGYKETCATDWASTLPGIPGNLANGEPIEVTAHIFYAPADKDLTSLTLRQVNDQGIAHLSVYSGPFTWSQETGKDPAAVNGGYMSLKLEGHQFGVQNQGETTRVAWIDKLGNAPHNVTFEMPLRPVDAVKVLLADDVADAN